MCETAHYRPNLFKRWFMWRVCVCVWETPGMHIEQMLWQRTGPCGSRNLKLPEFLENRHMKFARSSALCTGRLCLPGDIPGTNFCSDFTAIGNRTRDLSAFIAVPQPIAPLRAPERWSSTLNADSYAHTYFHFVVFHKWKVSLRFTDRYVWSPEICLADNNVSEELPPPEDGGSRFFQIIGTFLPNYTPYSGMPKSCISLLWKTHFFISAHCWPAFSTFIVPTDVTKS
jgi:hypothetical protein